MYLKNKKRNWNFKIRWLLLGLCFNLWIASNVFAQSFNPVRTERRSPDESKPTSYTEWKARWDAKQKFIGGEVTYRSARLQKTELDSFVFGDDFVYFKGFVRNSDFSLCEQLPPVTSFIVLLNGDDNKILTDESPRWSFGDPNISGKGYYGIELGNFADPDIAVGDSFRIIFSCYEKNEFEQGELQDVIPSIPLLPTFPSTLQMQPANIPLPPDSIKINREESNINICWEQLPGLSYTIYRRSINDTLVLHFPRYQYKKIATDIIDSCFTDTTIDTADTYKYIMFAQDIATGLISGRSTEITQPENINEVRAVFVEPWLYSDIENRLLQMVQDWEEEGAKVVVYSMQFPNHQALRDTLKSIKDLKGALLIGDFPVPWFQKCGEDGEHYQEYPVDLYYMDLDGIWQDNLHYKSGVGLIPGSDDIYDTHIANYPRGTEAPEIVIGRITPTPGMGDATEIINNYLNKCHCYRQNIDGIRQKFKALAYPDDDWSQWGNYIARDYISMVYGECTCINDSNTTTATDYKSRLDNNYSLIHVWVHSWEQGHSFKIDDGNADEYFYNYQILPAKANANFYNLFACGNSRYIEDKNCAAIYALQTTAGINTIGTTHSGGMLAWEYFYEKLAEGISFGNAFLKTYQKVGEGKFTEESKGWYYGLTFNGDPFVVPQIPYITNIAQENVNSIPTKLNLTNYPNPFNAVTKIQFQIPKAGFVSLKIYDILGREKSILVNEKKHAGNFEILFNGTDLVSGVYFYKLQAGKLFETKKFILIK